VSIEAIVSPKTAEQECEESGGFLLTSIFNAVGESVPFPEIDVENLTTSQTWQAVPASGKYTFVVPEGIDVYKIEVAKNGYSQTRTYEIGETYGSKIIVIPESTHATVFEGNFTEKSFSIDRLSSFDIFTLSSQGADSFLDSFIDDSKVSEQDQVKIFGEEVNLDKIEGVYFEGGTIDDNLCFFPGIAGDCGQSFTTGSVSKQVSEISLYLKKTTSSPSNIYLEIRLGSTSGSLIASSNIVNSSTLLDDLGWVNFSFTIPVDLQISTQYFLRLRSIPDSCDPGSGAIGEIRWGFSNSDLYQGGSAWRYIEQNQNPGDSGEELTDNDFSFRIYEDEYYDSGYLISEEISSADLLSWEEFFWSDYEPSGTQIIYQILYSTTTGWELIPESDLPGNSTGFNNSPINLSSLNISDYSSLKLKTQFLTSDSFKTPTLYDWLLSWVTSQSIPINNVSFDLRGEKIVGKDSTDDPIYKYSTTSITNAVGRLILSSMEWDSYSFSNFSAGGGNLDLVRSEPNQPVNLLPDTTIILELHLDAENSLLVEVNDISTGEKIFSAQIRIYNVGLSVDITQYTDINGKTFFIPLESAFYDIEVKADNYQDYDGTVSVSGDETEIINLNPL